MSFIRAALAIAMVAAANTSFAEGLSVGEESKRACLYDVDETIRVQKLNDPKFMKEASEEGLRSGLNDFCLAKERDAVRVLRKIAAAVPDRFIYICNERAKTRGDEYSARSYAAMLECFNDQLIKQPRAELPRGSATLHDGGSEHRFWTVEECLSARKDGQVCVTH